ncbi:MAG TPA: methyltransferase domain-containing protein [Chthoniobacterales bacterium]|nr:methyltransferase domain-containing protein [Chthoniobacterales bacterium]
MIETTVPEINVSVLMEQVRLKAASIQRIEAPKLGAVARLKRVDLPPLDLIPPQPPLLLPEPVPARKERILAMLDQAWKRTAVRKWIPKPLRVFFRNQEDYNRALLESVASLAKANAELANRVEQLTRCFDVEQAWLAQMHERASGHSKWMETAGPLLGSASVDLQLFREEAREQLNAAKLKLDKFAERQEGVEEIVRKLNSEMEGASNNSALGKSVEAIVGEVQTLLRERERMAERLSQLGDGNATLRADLQADLARVGEHLRNLQVVHDRNDSELSRVATSALALQRTIAALEERQVSEGAYFRMELSQQASLLRQWFASRGSKENQKLPAARKETPEDMPGRLDAFYVSFEDRFRGPRKEIKKRVEFYLPVIRKARAGRPEAPVLDVGCGRGEWLELLKDHKLEASGVDINSAMLAQCRERGLKVAQGDAIAHLRALPEHSLGAVTGFHIIEHLALEILMDLLAETIRVLVPGGVAIFESPNCKNLVVGATNFNIDPTHRNPVFPETAQFMLSIHGFEDVQLKYLAPVEANRFPDKDPQSAVLNELLYGPQDFAVIGNKPSSS